MPGGPLPPKNFSGLFLKVLHRPLTAPLVAKLAPPVAPPNQNVWLRPCIQPEARWRNEWNCVTENYVFLRLITFFSCFALRPPTKNALKGCASKPLRYLICISDDTEQPTRRHVNFFISNRLNGWNALHRATKAACEYARACALANNPTYRLEPWLCQWKQYEVSGRKVGIDRMGSDAFGCMYISYKQ